MSPLGDSSLAPLPAETPAEPEPPERLSVALVREDGDWDGFGSLDDAVHEAAGALALHPLLTNIQTSWVKMGPEGVKVCLRAGANDLGGTLMDETITRSAGAVHGQEMTPAAMEATVRSLGRLPRQRTTTYETAPAERVRASFAPRDAALRETVTVLRR